MTAWTIDRRLELADRWLRGETGGQIAKAMGITKSAVISCVARNKLPRRNAIIGRTAREAACAQGLRLGPVWTEADDAECLAMRGRGCMLAEIAVRLGRPVGGVKSRLKKLMNPTARRVQAGAAMLPVGPVPALPPPTVVALPSRLVVAPSAPMPPVPVLPTPLQAARASSIPLRRDQPCQWPTTDEATRKHSFLCCEPRRGGGVYCASHAAIAYRSVGHAA